MLRLLRTGVPPFPTATVGRTRACRCGRTPSVAVLLRPGSGVNIAALRSRTVAVRRGSRTNSGARQGHAGGSLDGRQMPATLSAVNSCAHLCRTAGLLLDSEGLRHGVGELEHGIDGLGAHYLRLEVSPRLRALRALAPRASRSLCAPVSVTNMSQVYCSNCPVRV